MVISRLPSGGGGGADIVFNISTTESALYGKTVTITNGNTVNKTVTLSASGQATVKVGEGGDYVFTCEKAIVEKTILYNGSYDIDLVTNMATITVTGSATLAPTMDSNYTVPSGYYKTDSINGFQVSVDGTVKSFANNNKSLTFVVKTDSSKSVTITYSDESGFTTPTSETFTVTKGQEYAKTVAWVEKYKTLTVTTTEAKLLALSLSVSDGTNSIVASANWTSPQTFILKSINTWTITCGTLTKQVNVTSLDSGTLTANLVSFDGYLFNGGNKNGFVAKQFSVLDSGTVQISNVITVNAPHRSTATTSSNTNAVATIALDALNDIGETYKTLHFLVNSYGPVNGTYGTSGQIGYAIDNHAGSIYRQTYAKTWTKTDAALTTPTEYTVDISNITNFSSYVVYINTYQYGGFDSTVSLKVSKVWVTKD